MNIKAIKKDKEQQRREDIERIKLLRPMDDDFLRELLRDDLPLIQEILRIIMQMDDLVVTRAQTQYDLERISGARGLCLDVWAEDSSGHIYNLEIQRDDSGAAPHRARYHSAALDVENLRKGQDFDMLPDTYVIFITENDIFGSCEAVYPVERINTVTGKPFGDGEHILYVNGAYEGDSDIGRLIHDFRCADPREMYNELLSERSHYLKETEKGVSGMCRIFEEVREEAMQVAEIQKTYAIALKLLKAGMGIDFIVDMTDLSPEDIREIAEENGLARV